MPWSAMQESLGKKCQTFLRARQYAVVIGQFRPVPVFPPSFRQIASFGQRQVFPII